VGTPDLLRFLVKPPKLKRVIRESKVGHVRFLCKTFL